MPPSSASTSSSSSVTSRARTLARHVEHDVASAEESGVRGTPTFFVGDTRHIGPHDAQTLIAALESSTPMTRPIG